MSTIDLDTTDNGGGIDLSRLKKLDPDYINGLLCAYCKKLVVDPMECQNDQKCGKLFCRNCMAEDDTCPKCIDGKLKIPSDAIIKNYSMHKVECFICQEMVGACELSSHSRECLSKIFSQEPI